MNATTHEIPVAELLPQHRHHHEQPQGAPILKVSGLKKAYGAIQAVGGVSFEVFPGEIFGVIGPNGSGKTTLFNSMLGQITPDAGKIELNGEDVTQLGYCTIFVPSGPRPMIPGAPSPGSTCCT